MRPQPPLPPQQGPVQHVQYQWPVQQMAPMQPVYTGPMQPTYQQPVQSMRPMVMTPQPPYNQSRPSYPPPLPNANSSSMNPLSSTARFSSNEPRASKKIESPQAAAPRKNLLKIKTILEEGKAAVEDLKLKVDPKD